MSDANDPQKATSSGIAVDGDASKFEAVTGTVTLSRGSMGREGGRGAPPPPPEKAAAPPQSEVAKMPYSVATGKDVACAKCSERFDVSSDFYNTVTECPSCKSVFVIRPPGTPPYKPPAGGAAASPAGGPPEKATTSGIQVEKGGADKYGITGTVLLSREGMGMMQKKRGERRQRPGQQGGAPAAAGAAPPAPNVPADIIYSVATENDVGCPKCDDRFEISPEFYGAVAECPECGSEFLIKPPGTPPYQAPGATASAPAAAPAPAAASAPAQDAAAPADSGKKSNTALYVAIGAGAVVILLLVVLIVVIATK